MRPGGRQFQRQSGSSLEVGHSAQAPRQADLSSSLDTSPPASMSWNFPKLAKLSQASCHGEDIGWEHLPWRARLSERIHTSQLGSSHSAEGLAGSAVSCVCTLIPPFAGHGI